MWLGTTTDCDIFIPPLGKEEMTPQYRIFYSWQSDNKKAKTSLKKALTAVVEQLKKEGVSVEIVEGGGGIGFISIEDAVRIKIRRCDIFVGDVTPVGSVALRGKLLPNANVMYEMGIATESMTADRVLAVAMKGDWNIEDMPFDFNHYAMVLYDADGEKKLQNAIKQRISEVVTYAKRVNSRFFSERLLTKNIETKKYMPAAFLENRRAKNTARCFVAPLKMYNYLYEQVERLDFTMLNRRKNPQGVPYDFHLDVKKWDIRNRAIDLDALYSKVAELKDYLYRKVAELDRDGNWGWRSSLKIKHLAEQIEVLNKPLMVVTSEAGQGKTNFVCDLVQNVLIPDGIPYVFVNAYELSAESLATSIAQEYNFIGDGSLENVVLKAEQYCYQQLQYFVIVIDGLNEHPNQRLFKTNLVRVLNALRGYKHVKVLMTCRKEFYENNLAIVKSSFVNDLVEVTLSIRRSREEIEENDWECLKERYAAHFGTTGELGPVVSYDLRKSNSLLFLRIFFETYSGQDLSDIRFLNYTELYEKYFQLLCGKIQENIEEGSNISVSRDIAKSIFTHLLGMMIKSDYFRNIPLQHIVKALPASEQNVFRLFMNANLALQYDYPEIASGMVEVVNFTFEEIRDYLLVRYLVEVEYESNPLTFWKHVEQYTKGDNNLAEGVRRFLFLYAKNNEKTEIYKKLKTYDWFEETFMQHVLYVDDNKLEKDDVEYAKAMMIKHPEVMVKRVVYEHWMPWQFTNLNINSFFEIADGMSDGEREKFINKIWPNTVGGHYYSKVETDRKRMARMLQTAIENREKEGKKGIKELKKWQSYLVKPGKKVKAQNQEAGPDYAVRGYDIYRYLMTVHRGEREEFLHRAGTMGGFSKQMMGDFYDNIFKEGIDVEYVYKTYFYREYNDLSSFLSLHYSIPMDNVKVFMDVLKNEDYRIMDFSSIDYGNDAFDNFVFSDKMFDRFYKWINWM